MRINTDIRPDPDDLRRWHRTPDVSGHEILKRADIDVPPDSELSDREIDQRLWQIVHHLATRGIYFSSTDHLSNRQLYRLLRGEVLHDAFKDPDRLPEDLVNRPGAPVNFLDLGFGTSPESIDRWIAYYAPDTERQELIREGFDIPPRRKLPFDRDRHLPKPPRW
ncbi:MAG: hypothetical protein RL885_07640 [Planctomycetota bacterium]